GPARRRARGGEPRPLEHPGAHARSGSGCAGAALRRAVRGGRRADGKGLRLDRPQSLRPARPEPGARPRAPSAEAPVSPPRRRSPAKGSRRSRLADDPRWYQRAVFYEVVPRGFFDANDDGTGDLSGIVAKLDYLSWLGIDCIWLLPFYESPLRDGGYDISDFFSVHHEYGDLGDAVHLVESAHRRGIRVIADLVMNHT